MSGIGALPPLSCRAMAGMRGQQTFRGNREASGFAPFRTSSSSEREE